jgi:hypothetical protein
MSIYKALSRITNKKAVQKDACKKDAWQMTKIGILQIIQTRHWKV